VIVLMLPLVFAALVWPARRIWALRTVELLIALILSKCAIVAVLALGGAAMSQSVGHSVTGFLAGIVLVVLAAFAPWALVRLMPLSELASGAAGSLRPEARALRGSALAADTGAHMGADWAVGLTSRMQRQLQETSASAGAQDGTHDLSTTPPTPANAGAGPGTGDGMSNHAHADALGADDGATKGMSGAGQFDRAGPGAQSVDSGAPVWHAPDETLPPLPLDLEHLQGPQLPWGQRDADDDVDSGRNSVRPSTSSEAPGTGEDHDPRPPAQDQDGGLL